MVEKNITRGIWSVFYLWWWFIAIKNYAEFPALLPLLVIISIVTIGLALLHYRTNKEHQSFSDRQAEHLQELEEGLTEPSNSWEMEYVDKKWREAGILEPDQATEWTHLVNKRQEAERNRGEFTPVERETIRRVMGMI